MKVYRILTTVIVEDKVDDSRIGELCENLETIFIENFGISNFITFYELDKTIDYPDTPPGDEDPGGEKYDKWMDKSQEIIESVIIEIRNM